MKLVSNLGNSTGSYIVEVLDAGAPVYGFDLSFKAAVGHEGNALPADGWSVNYASDVLDGGFGVAGVGTGFTVFFDDYNNGGEAPAVGVKIGGVQVASRLVPLAQIQSWSNPDHYADVQVKLDPDGSLDVAFNGVVFYTNYFVPNYQPVYGGRLGIGANTGGSAENVWIDNLSFTTFLTPSLGISAQPESAKVAQGSPVTFSVQTSNGEGASYQWLRNGVAIPNATDTTYTIASPGVGDFGSVYAVRVSSGTDVVTSADATLTVLDITVPTPQGWFDFDDALLPEGTSVFGTAMISSYGGVLDSGGLQLTFAEAGDEGYFSIPNTIAQPVFGFAISFDALIGGGSVPPADGFSVNFASDIPETLAGLLPEDGIGTGVSVNFDLYDSGGGEAPAIDVKVGGSVIASVKVPVSFLETGIDYAPVVIRMQNDGTIDVVYKGVVVIDNLQTPFASVTGGQILFGARTGGSFENQWFDNIEFSADTTPGSLRITQQPTATTSLVGTAASFSVEVNDATGATYQYFRDGVAIADATSATYTLPSVSAADEGAKFKVQVSNAGGSVTSEEVTLSVLDLSVPSNPDLAVDFNTPVSTNVGNIYGTAAYRDFGGVADSGYVSLTDAIGGQNGTFVLKPAVNGAELNGFTITYDILVGGGGNVPADGYSFEFGNELPNGTIGDAEDGTEVGLVIGFDIFNNSTAGTAAEAPTIDVRYKGTLVTQAFVPLSTIETGTEFAPVIIRVEPDGTLDLVYKGKIVFNNLQVPGWAPEANGKFGWYARTGGSFENQWLDNVKIAVSKTTGPLRIVSNPENQVVLSGHAATFSVGLSDPTGATHQWLKNGEIIAGATSSSYTTAAATGADNGTTYSVRITGPGGTVTSTEATLVVIDSITVSNPQFSVDFNDGMVPDNSLIVGVDAYIDTGSAGGNDSLVLHLTDDAGSAGGGFVIQDLNAGVPVSAFTASFKMLIGLNAGTPADGLSFVMGSDLPEDTNWREMGPGGNSLAISFDTYNNNGEAPAISIVWQGAVVVTTKFPIEDVLTGSQFENVFVRLESDGTVDLVYKDKVIYYNVQLPNFAPIANAKFGFGAGTGGAAEAHWIDDVQIATSTEAAAPSITGSHLQTGNLVIDFTGGGSLESTTDLGTGTWTPVPNGGTSPVSVPATGKAQFFRVKR